MIKRLDHYEHEHFVQKYFISYFLPNAPAAGLKLSKSRNVIY